MRWSDMIGGGNNYAYSCYEFFFINRYGSPSIPVSPHKILHCESKSTVTHHPVAMKTCVCLIVGSRLANVACYTNEYPIQLTTAKKHQANLYPFNNLCFLLSADGSGIRRRPGDRGREESAAYLAVHCAHLHACRLTRHDS